MATVTIRPTNTPYIQGWVIGGGGGAATQHAATSDNLDTTYIYSAITGNVAYQGFGTPVIPTGAIVMSVQARVRGQTTLTTNAWLDVVLYNIATSQQALEDILMPYNVITTIAGSVRTRNPAGQPWANDFASTHAMYLRPWGTATGHYIYAYELYLDVVYNEIPVVSAVTPNGAIAVSSPTIGWTYTDPESDPIARVRTKIFTAAQYGAAGFDPETSTPFWDSAEVTVGANTTSYAPPTTNPLSLVSGTYRAYVKAADQGSDRGTGVYRYSAWAFSGFTVSLVPPATPVPTSVVEVY